MTEKQLVLIEEQREESDPWRLDEHTKQVGRRGVQSARKALAEAARKRNEAA